MLRLGLVARLAFVALLAFAPAAPGLDRFVSPEGDDDGPGTKDQPWKTIQRALDWATAGDSVIVLPGVYLEAPIFPNSGDAKDGPITLRGREGAIVDGSKNGASDNLVEIYHQRYIRVIGLHLRNFKDIDDGSGIRVEGECSHIELRDNVIHEVRGKNAMGITVYGTSAEHPITDIVIDGNEIYDCDPAPSEALVVNGNVERFEITNNIVRDVNNIGIDVIGGEKSICKDTTKVPRGGVCANNIVRNARSSYGGGYGAGIYCDGAKDLMIENNTVENCDIGIEVGAENKGVVTTGVIVRGNTVRDNDKAGIAIGGYNEKRGRVEGCTFEGNVLQNNTGAGKKAQGEVWVQAAAASSFRGNVVVGTGERPLLLVEKFAGADNVFAGNTWFSERGAAKSVFVWRGKWLEGFEKFKSTSGQGQGSKFEKEEVAPEPAPEVRKAERIDP